jgi:rhamnosyltransferase
MNQNVAVSVITFHPGASVLTRLQETIQSGYKLYIFDNSPENAVVRDFIQANSADASQVTYLTCGKNVGLGFGLSTVCSHAYYDSFPTLLFFDQDTVYSRITLDYISDFYTKNIGLADQYSSISFNSKSLNAPAPEDVAVKDVRLTINSGSLFYLANLEKMNWHSTKYFVDCVDYEFCLSSSNHHLKIGEHSATPGFDHCAEQGDAHYKVFGMVLQMRAYRCSRIWDSYSASVKLIFKAIATGNFIYAVEITKAIHKYLFVQFYVRIAKILHLKGC